MPTNVMMSLMNESSRLEDESRSRKRKCSEGACIHSPTEILLNPEILLDLQTQGFHYNGGIPSANPLLEFCLDGGCFGKLARMSPVKDKHRRESPLPPSFLLLQASSSNLLDPERLQLICQTESCDINVQNQSGESALHLLIKGCSPSSFPSVLKCFKVLLDFEINTNLSDSSGNTPLHVLQGLLTRNMTSEARCLALLLLEAQADINAVNHFCRSILSMSVDLPAAESFVRLLLEHGALIWPSSPSGTTYSVESLTREREESAFTWFVRSAIFHRELTPGHLKVLGLLCHSMSDEVPDPSKLKRRVLSTLIHLGRSTKVLGPTFSQLKRIICPFWTRPLPLKYLCKRKIRSSMGAGAVPGNLYLPQSLRDYLELERTEF